MASEDVTLRLKMLDEFSPTTTKFVREMKTAETAATTASKKMETGFASASSKLQQLDSIGVPGVGRLATAFETAGAAQASFLGSTGLVVAGAAAAAAGFAAIAAVSVSAASEAEQAEVRLTSALKATGQYTKEAVESVGQWANGLLLAKGVSDELAMSLVGQGATMGLTVAQSKLFVSAAADMEEITGSLAGGFEALARASTGDERAIKSLARQFGLAAEEGLTFEKLLAKIQERTNGAAAAKVETFAGAWGLVKNQLGNVAETIGAKLIPALTNLAKGTSAIIDFFTGAKEAAETARIKAELDAIGTSATKAIKPVESLSVTLARAVKNAKIVSDSWKDSLKGLEKDFDKATDSLKKKQTEYTEWLKKSKATIEEVVKGSSNIGTAGQTDSQRSAAAAASVQQLLIDAENETGQKRMDLLVKYAKAYEETKAAEVAADRQAITDMAQNDAEQYALDWTSLEASLQAKTDLYTSEYKKIVDMINEQYGSISAAANADIEAGKAVVAETGQKILDLKGQIADVTADITRIDEILKDEKTLSINAAQALADMNLLTVEITAMDAAIKQERSVSLKAQEALDAAKAVKDAIDLIPDISYKTVIIEYKTKASPIRPFSEGIADIKSRMQDLPSKSTHTVNVNGAGSGSSAGGSASFNATINVGGSGGATSGKAIDSELAALWNSKRSKLRKAMEAA